MYKNKEVDKIRKRFTRDELERMFIKRIDDEMFLQIGKSASSQMDGLPAVWLGYEILTRSTKCPQRYL